MTDTSTLRQWDRDHVWHPFTPMQAYRQLEPPIIESGDGFYLVDTQGNRYLDGTASMWCNVHGHCVPQIDAAIREQLDRVAHSTLLGQANVPSIKLAKELVVRMPKSLNKVFYSDDGATAVEVAVKLAYQYYCQREGGDAARRDLFLCLGNAYHGDTLGSASVGGVPGFHALFQPLLFPTIKLPTPVTYRVPHAHTAQSWLEFCFAEMEREILANKNRLAGFIIEPLVQGAAGILTHPPGYLRRVRELTAKHDILLIADEVAVGCGRTGTFLACEQEQVIPDLVCLAKGLTGGYLPLAVTIASEAIYEAFLGPPSAMKTFFHGHTYTGNQLGCAAALASLRLMDENGVLANVRRNSAVLTKRFDGLARHPHVGEIRQRGMMCGIELVFDKETQERYPSEMRQGYAVCDAVRRRGVILRPLGDVVTIIPPLAIGEPLIHQICDALAEAIDEVC